MKNAARLSRLERIIPKPRCECESENKPLRVVQVGDGELEPSAWCCPKCGRTKLLIVVKYLAAGLWDALQ